MAIRNNGHGAVTPDIDVDVDSIQPQKPGGNEIRVGGGGNTIGNLDLSRLRASRGGGGSGRSGGSGGSGGGGGGGGSDAAAAAAAAAAAEAERRRKEQENLRREKDDKIAKQEQKRQQQRRDNRKPTLEVFGMETPDGSFRLSDSSLERALDQANGKQVSPAKTSAAERMYEEDGIPTGRVDDQAWLNEMDDIDSLNDMLGSLRQSSIPNNNQGMRHMPEYDPASDNILTMYRMNPRAFPEGKAKDWLEAQARKLSDRKSAERHSAERMRAMEKVRRQMKPAYARHAEDTLVNASIVGKEQLDQLEEAVRKFEEENPGKSRYMTIDEIRDAAKEFLDTEPISHTRRYEFADDRAFTDEVWYDEELKDEEIRKKIAKDAGAMWGDINEELDARRQSKETSLDTLRHGGAAEYDPDSTVAQNVLNAENAVDGNARLIANPLIIKWGSEFIERTKTEYGKTLAKFRFSNRVGRDVEGAIGSVMRYYNCSTMSVLRLVIRQLGLGIDTHGKICGVPAEEFRIPDVLIIEACNDILMVAKRNNGIPTGINVMGKEYGYDNSRDDTGMFPILGGTRCFPMGHIPVDTFRDISGPGSPLYMMPMESFYQRNIELYVNDVQPYQMANCTGPRAFQAVALNLANEGMLSVDGLPNSMYEIPEHQVYRTKAVLEADLMDTTDEQCEEAKIQRLKNHQEIDSRMRRMFFKDGDSRSNSSEKDVPPGTLLGPGKDARSGPLTNTVNTFTSLTAMARIASAGITLSAIPENLFGVAMQGTTIMIQNIGKRIAKGSYHVASDGSTFKLDENDSFDRTKFLDDTITSDDALEALEVYLTLFKIGGRTAVQEFMIDQNDKGNDRRYKYATKANMYDFLQRWKMSQSPEAAQRIEQMIGFLMIGEGMFKKTKARQFLDMALIEMQNNRIHGLQAFNSDNLEEIARSGINRKGAGEALVSALIDTQAGYEAFKTIDYATFDRTSPVTRAIDATLRGKGVTELAFRRTICMFPRFFVGRMSRAMPGFCSISYMMSHLAKNAAKVERDAMDESYDPTNKICKSFAQGFRQAADAVTRISDYQVGMDSADFWVGLRKNMLYDATLFGGQYIVMGMIKRGIIALLGGWEPPEDESKITLPWEWKLKLTGLPMKDAWFTDDLFGCGAPLAYALEILDGYDIKDKEGNVVRHVDAYSDEAKKVAWQVYKNTIRSYGPTKDAIDAMEMITDFPEQIEEIMGKDLWRQSPAESLKDYVGDIDKEMSEYYKDSDYDLTVDQMRREWAIGRVVGFAFDMFDDLTPKIASQVLPGSRDSFVRDKHQHVTKLEYDLDNYDEETAKSEYRVKKRPYLEWQMALRTRDNAVEAYLTDFCTNLFNLVGLSDNQANFSYMEMPVRTSTDPRPRSENSHMERWSLDQYFENGNMVPDLTGPEGKPDGVEDTRSERQSYLFDRAEELCEYIDENFISQDRYPEWAVQNDHFIIPADMRAVAKDYCYYMLGTKNKKGQLEKEIEARKKEMGGRVPQEEWDNYKAMREKYSTILYDYLDNDRIPWRAPRYAKLESSTATMYVDDDGNATTWDDPNAHAIDYSYGDAPSVISPLVSPVDQGNYDLQGFTWDTLLDDDGRPISRSSMESIYDQAANAGRIVTGIGTGDTALDVMTAGGAIQRGDAPVPFDERGWEAMDTTLPVWYSELDKEAIDKKYGIDSYMPDDETDPDSDEEMSSDGSNSMYNNRGYGGSYGYSFGGGGGGGGYYYSYGGGGSNYTPKIYSTSKSIYSQRASGMRSSSPYKATTSYLRPGFYTKGSREAYKRSDM